MKRTVPVDKVCPVCQESFQVCPPGKTSRSFPRYSQIFCSLSCQARGRYRSGFKCNTLTPEQAAYIAGFMDGEGSIMLYMRRDAVALRITFSNTLRPVLEWITYVIGCGNIVSHDRHNPNHKEGHHLQLNAEAALSLLEQIEPFLIIKKEQCALAIEFHHRLQDPQSKADRQWQYKSRETMQRLNKRGK